MKRLELRLLGASAVLEDGQRLALPSRKAMILLAKLATSRGLAVSRAEAVSFLWPDVASDKGRASLRQTLARLRQALPAEALHADAYSIQLPTGRWWIDIHDLDTALGGPWTIGEFVAGEYFGEANIDRWLDEERRHWREAALARLRSAHQRQDQGDPQRRVDVCHAILALDPYDEHTHRELMLALAELGHTGRAIKQFEALALLLDTELGIEPQAETRTLARELRQKKHDPVRPKGAAPAGLVSLEPLSAMRLITVVSLASTHLPAAAMSALKSVADRQHGALWPGEPTRLVLGLQDAAQSDVIDALASVLPYRNAAGIGCASGLALIGAEEQSGARQPTGAVVAQADMLAMLAEPSEMLIQDALRRQLGEMADVSEISVRGRSAWAFHGFTNAQMRPSPAFVGRASECSQIATLVDNMCAGRGGALVVTGVPGIGKTRLIDEALKTRQSSGVTLVEAAFQAFGDGETAFRTRLAGALRACLPSGFSVNALPLHLRRTARTLFEPTEDPKSQPVGSGDEWQVREIVVSMIDTLTQAQPLIVRIEDTHWANETQIAFLIGLFEHVGSRPVLFLATERPAEDKLAAAVRTRSADYAGLVIALAPLRTQDAQSLLSGADLSEGDISKVVEKAEGNPLFLLHLAATAGLSNAFPVNLISLVQEQLDHHPHEVAASCHRAAVLGHRFSNAAFAAAFPEMSLANLIRSGFVTVGETETMFTHALIQEAIYAMVPQDSLKAFHQRAADAFRSQSPVLWAEHTLRVGRDRHAARACLAALELLVLQRRLSTALRFADDGLSCDSDDATKAHLLFWRGNTLRETAAFHDALADYEAAAALSTDADLSVQVALKRWAVHKYLGQLNAACEHLTAATTLAEGVDLSAATRSELAQEQGDAAFQDGDGAQCLRYNETAYQIAREAGLYAAEARALGGLGDAHYAGLDLKRALDAFTACISLAVHHELEAIATAHRPMAAISRFYVEAGIGPMEDAAMAVEQAVIARSMRNEMLALSVLGEVQAFAADRDGLNGTVQRLADLIGDSESRFRADYAMCCVFAQWLSGRSEDAFAQTQYFLAEHDEPYMAPEIAGIAAVTAKREAQARAAVDTGLRILERGVVAHSFLAYHHFAMRAAIRWGWPGCARDLADQLAARINLKECTFGRLAHDQTLAALDGSDADRAAVQAQILDAHLGLFLFEG